ncbi:MAG TPA: hypothetical protein VJS64_17635 [Pyrinomonadaceae bacterium]|nr:hypothetical protein [Pyrinomonadaceae bacterium]
MAVETTNVNFTKPGHQSGFSLLQMMIVVLVIAVIGGMAAYGIVQARQRIRLTNSARMLASYLEKARVDSVRRHPLTNAEMGSVTFTSNTTYTVRYDIDGNGSVDTRNVTLEHGIVVLGTPVPTRFDWRGRFITDNPAITRISITLQYGTRADDQRTIDVTRSGDVTIDSREYLDDVPNVNVNSNLSGIDSGSTINGNTNPYPSPSPTPTAQPTATPYPTATPLPSPTAQPTATPFPTATPQPTPTAEPTATPLPTPTPTPAPCVVDITPPALSIRKNGGSAPLVFTVSGGTGAVAVTDAPPNIQVTETSTYHFTVTSVNNSRGDFTVYFSTPCGARQVTVSVTN